MHEHARIALWSSTGRLRTGRQRDQLFAWLANQRHAVALDAVALEELVGLAEVHVRIAGNRQHRLRRLRWEEYHQVPHRQAVGIVLGNLAYERRQLGDVVLLQRPSEAQPRAPGESGRLP